MMFILQFWATSFLMFMVGYWTYRLVVGIIDRVLIAIFGEPPKG